MDRFALEMEMEKLHRRLVSGNKIHLPTTSKQSALFSFIATVARVYQRLGPEGQRRLSGMLRDGFNAELGMASVQHEMEVAVHLMTKGFDVRFWDIENDGRFDILAEREGVEIEVECRVFSGDLGRKIHRRRFYRLGAHTYPLMVEALNKRPGGQFVRIQLPNRLDGTDQQTKDICARLAQVFQNCASITKPEPCALEYQPFSISDLPLIPQNPTSIEKETVRDFLAERFGGPIKNFTMLSRPLNGVVVVAVESLRSDNMVDYLFRDLKQKISSQFTKSRASILCVKFSDISNRDLIEIADKDRLGQPSALKVIANRLFERANSRHVHTVSYLAPGPWVSSRTVGAQTVTHLVQEEGKSYYFSNPLNANAGDKRFRIF